MICDRKKLAAALGKALKTGYQLYVDGNEIHIISRDWCFSGTVNECGNELLAAIVLHLGTLPRSCCIFVAESKEGGEKTVARQELLPDVFFTELAEWEPSGEATPCVFTSLKLGSALLYQLPDGRILGANVSAALLTDSARVGVASGEASVGWMDDDSVIRFRAHRPDPDSELRAKWRALESVRWTEAGE